MKITQPGHPKVSIERYFDCVPYLVSRNDDGCIFTIIKTNERILFIGESSITHASHEYLLSKFTPIRKYVSGDELKITY